MFHVLLLNEKIKRVFGGIFGGDTLIPKIILFLLLTTFLLETEPQILKEALSVLMLCAPNNRQRPFSYHTKMADFEYFRVLSALS